MFSLNEASALAREPDLAAALEAVDRYLAARAGAPAFRQARGIVSEVHEKNRFRSLAEVGLNAAFLSEATGGSALPESAAALFAERCGWWLARAPFLENIVFPTALATRIEDDETLAAMAAGKAVCVAWQEDAFDLSGPAALDTSLMRDGQGWRLRGRKRFVMGASGSDRILVLAQQGQQAVIVCVTSTAAGVVRTDKLLADGSHWSELDFDLVLPPNALRAQGPQVHEAVVQAVAVTNLAIAGMLHGLQSRMLAMTLDYLRTRVQFGQAIGSFQALQHRATELYTHAQITRFLVGEAADALRERDESGSLQVYASRAKARAADSAQRIAKEAIQMHGAMGFSDEYDLGLYVKRVLVMSAWLGGADWHRRHLARIDPLELELEVLT